MIKTSHRWGPSLAHVCPSRITGEQKGTGTDFPSSPSAIFSIKRCFIFTDISPGGWTVAAGPEKHSHTIAMITNTTLPKTFGLRWVDVRPPWLVKYRVFVNALYTFKIYFKKVSYAQWLYFQSINSQGFLFTSDFNTSPIGDSTHVKKTISFQRPDIICMSRYSEASRMQMLSSSRFCGISER